MTNNYHTPIPIGAAADAFTFRTPLGELDEAITALAGGPAIERFQLATPNVKTISSGAITIDQALTQVDTEGAAALDDLVTINGGEDGWLLMLSTVSAGRDVHIWNGLSNIYLWGTDNLTLTDPRQRLLLIRHNGEWFEVSNAAASAAATQEEFPHVTGGNSNVETTIVSKLIPASSMGTKGLIRLHASVLIINNTGATQDVTYRWKFGGTTIASRLLSSSTVYTAIRMSLALREGNGTARQLAEAYLRRVSLNSLGTVGAASHEMTMNILTVNHALDQTVQFSLQFTNALPTLTWELVDALLEGPFPSS